MLFPDYDLEIRRAAACKPGTPPLFCKVRLHGDIGAALPYLNAILPGIGFVKHPPAMLIRKGETLVAIHGREITISPVRDRVEAEELLEWLREKVNEAWKKRGTTRLSFTTRKPLTVMAILRELPRNNCGECGFPTCTVFATRLTREETAPGACPYYQQD